MRVGAERSRDHALDFTRGALVLCMVAYHAVNYSGADQAVLRHLRFLPGAFVFLAGLGVGRLYLPRWSAGESGLPGRLWWRGWRILALFLALNVLAHALLPASYNRRLDLEEFAGRLGVILGPGEVRAAVFGVLLPIAYVLAASGALLACGRGGRGGLLLLGSTVFGGTVVLSIFSAPPLNLELAALGLLGVVVGGARLGNLPPALCHPAGPLLLFVLLQVIISGGEPGFPLTSGLIMVTLATLYTAGRRLSPRFPGMSGLRLLGRNSLPAYLLQIAALQMLFRGLRAAGLGPPDTVLAMAFAGTLTIAGVVATTSLRARVPLADRTYRTLFA
ncbi:MAG: hypothetical protein RIR76_85 [Verrucomicrobiota bacterium]|jgi:hypothetical protein|nr:OpgC domain-containing protein [Opitutaceae bacterium]